MKRAYPIVLIPVKAGGYAVKVPDLNIYTQGKDIAEAMYMARDAIGMWICYEQDEKHNIPNSSDLAAIKTETDEMKILVDIDVDEYRRVHDNRTVRKNLTLPSWLNATAEKAGVNFSQILQDALTSHLGLEHNHPYPVRKRTVRSRGHRPTQKDKPTQADKII
jgi:predicted RNase H-like HicB family nuclease